MRANNGGEESRIFDPGFAAEDEDVFVEYARLLTEGNDLQAENVAGTEEEVEEGEEANEKRNHSPRFIARSSARPPR
jgi:hypothetical protein